MLEQFCSAGLPVQREFRFLKRSPPHGGEVASQVALGACWPRGNSVAGLGHVLA